MHESVVSRRAFLRGTALVLGGLALGRPTWAEHVEAHPVLRFAAISDIHYADLPAQGAQHFRQAPAKLAAAIDSLRDQKFDFVVQLGDIIDRREADATQAIERLRTIDAVYAKAPCERHYVVGNHCAAWLTQDQLVEHSGARASYYSFDVRGFHFIVLDSCYTAAGEPFHYDQVSGRAEYHIPPVQLAWLQADLAGTNKPTIVLAHQPLGLPRGASVQNAEQVRRVLAGGGQVRAVFQGHIHRNEYVEIDGIHYCTLTAMVEGEGPASNAYAKVWVYDDASIRVEGFERQRSHELAAKVAQS
jgi:3',5'-cyclic AMP phosphodiesterase CpdA